MLKEARLRKQPVAYTNLFDKQINSKYHPRVSINKLICTFTEEKAELIMHANINIGLETILLSVNHLY